MSEPHAHAGGHADPEGDKIGMWLFLFTEVVLFGILFLVFAVYHREYPRDFMSGSLLLNKALGAVNTVILLTSSLTMALSIEALRRERKSFSLACLAATIGLAGVFLVIKALEWSEKIHHGIHPRSDFIAAWPPGQKLFLGLYFTMTGLHALHVLLGVGLLLWVMIKVRADGITGARISFIENSGLYWHLVDLIWIYLFPLFYLIGFRGAPYV